MTRVLVLLFVGIPLLGQAFSCAGPGFEGAGFLDDYSRLVRNPDTGAFVYRRSRDVLRGYDHILIEPVEILVDPEADTAVTEAELDGLAAKFREELERAVEDAYLLVVEPGPRVLRLRVALTDVHPIQYLLTDPVRETELLAAGRLGSASIEGEGLDAASGELLLAFADTRSSTGYTSLMPGELSRYGKALGAFRTWAQNLRQALDDARGAGAPSGGS